MVDLLEIPQNQPQIQRGWRLASDIFYCLAMIVTTWKLTISHREPSSTARNQQLSSVIKAYINLYQASLTIIIPVIIEHDVTYCCWSLSSIIDEPVTALGAT